MAAVSPTTLFNEKVPAAIAKDPAKARELNAIYQFKISGEGGGEWTVDLSSAAPQLPARDPGQGQLRDRGLCPGLPGHA